MTTLATAARNAACDAVVDLLDGGTLEFQTSGDVEVATLTFGTPAFGAAASGVATANAITEDSNSFTDSATTAWLSGGTVGSVTLTNRVTTAGGRTMDQSVNLTIVEK